MTTSMANELVASGKRMALLGICAAGGLAAAAVLENASPRGRAWLQLGPDQVDEHELCLAQAAVSDAARKPARA
jgi:hypothetical protein